MPSDAVMRKWKEGKLRSGSKKGPRVRSHKQAVAIMLSERRKEKSGNYHGQRKKTRRKESRRG